MNLTARSCFFFIYNFVCAIFHRMIIIITERERGYHHRQNLSLSPFPLKLTWDDVNAWRGAFLLLLLLLPLSFLFPFFSFSLSERHFFPGLRILLLQLTQILQLALLPLQRRPCFFIWRFFFHNIFFLPFAFCRFFAASFLPYFGLACFSVPRLTLVIRVWDAVTNVTARRNRYPTHKQDWACSWGDVSLGFNAFRLGRTEQQPGLSIDTF